MSHNTDLSILKINGCWTLNNTCLFLLSLKFVSVHLLPLILLFDCLQVTVLSFVQPRLKKDGLRNCFGKYLHINGKGLGKGCHFYSLDIFPDPQVHPLGYISKRFYILRFHKVYLPHGNIIKFSKIKWFSFPKDMCQSKSLFIKENMKMSQSNKTILYFDCFSAVVTCTSFSYL